MNTHAVSDPAAPTAGPVYRMRDLCEQTGLSRQAIHFYIQQGLVPEGTKTGRNMAHYGAEHIERLRLVRRLQEERYLPLKQIRALLDGDTTAISAAQRGLLREVQAQLAAVIGETIAVELDVDRHAADHAIEPAELARMIELALIPVRTDADGTRLSPADAVWPLELWTQLRALAANRNRAVRVDDLVPIHAAIVGTLS